VSVLKRMHDNEGVINARWELVDALVNHFYLHRVDNMYRTGRCSCGQPYGYVMNSHGQLNFKESCVCNESPIRAMKKVLAHTWSDLAALLYGKQQELSMLFDFDMDLLDLKEGNGD